MRILYIVPYVPNLIRVRPYNLIRALSARGNHLTVMMLWSDEQERAFADTLRAERLDVLAFRLPKWRSLINCLKALPTTLPLQAAYSWQPALAGQIKVLSNNSKSPKRFDVVHVEHLRGAQYGIQLKKGNGHHPSSSSLQLPIVWDSVDCISHLFRKTSQLSKKRLSRWLAGFEFKRTKYYEEHLIRQFDHVLVTSQVDKDAFGGLTDRQNNVPITILPNGVDLDYFKPDPTLDREPATLVISGKMSYHANLSMVLHLVQDIMPLIWEKRPEIKLWIVGKDPSKEIRDLARISGVTVTGSVPDIRPFLQRATIAVAPLVYGTGIQNKILEAMACATPVVCAPQAISAIEAEPGKEVLVAEKAEEFANKVLLLLAEPGLRLQIGLAGQKYVTMHHRWDHIASQLEEVYHEVLHTIH